MNSLLRRRALMGIGGKKEDNSLILTYQASGSIPYTAKTCLTDAMLTDVNFIKMDGVAMDTAATSYSINDTDLHTIEISFKEVPSTLANVSWNSNIRTIVIPNGVTSLPITFTYNCSNLTSVIIPDSVVSYGNGAFAYCGKLAELNIPEGTQSLHRFAMGDGLTSFIIPSTVTSIVEDLLSGCTKLNYIVFKSSTPPSFTYGAETIAFNNTNDCPIFVPDNSVAAYKQALSTYETRIKPMSEFYILKATETPNILAAFYAAGLCASPDYMTIAEAAIITNAQFDSVDFKDAAEDFSGFRYFTGVTTLSITRFTKYKFTKVVVPNSISSSNGFIFAECSNLISAVVIYPYTNITSAMFRFCTALREVVLGDSITSIATIAFQNCPVESLVCKAATPPVWSDDILLRSQAVVYVPDNSVSAYQAADNWSNYTIKGISEYQGNLIDYVL